MGSIMSEWGDFNWYQGLEMMQSREGINYMDGVVIETLRREVGSLELKCNQIEKFTTPDRIPQIQKSR